VSDFALPPLGIWSGQLEQVPSARSRELAAELEALGYGAVWLPEVAGRDPFVHLTMLLSATTTLVGATGIASIWARDAVTMTGAVRALTEAFPERVLVGLGVSHSNIVEGVRKHRYERPYSAMVEYLDAMEASPYQGFRPTTPIRLVLAALGPRMLRLAAERTEGAHPYLQTPEHTGLARATMGDEPLLCPEQMVVLETDPAAAREIARKGLAVYLAQPNYSANLRRLGFDETDLADGGSDHLVDALVAWGDEERIAARVEAQFDAGADHVCVQAMGAPRGEVPLAEWRALAPALTAVSAGRGRTAARGSKEEAGG
jgi:probable F420-dependent oxidoreductase